MVVVCPILGTQSPRVTVGHVAPLRYAPVFCVETDKVDSYGGRVVLLQQTGQLKHDGHARGSVVSS